MIADRARLFGILLGVMGLVLLLEWVWPAGGAAGGLGRLGGLHLPQSVPKANLQARAAEQWAATVLARPLFTISRRPPRVETSRGTAAAPDQARLSGILIGRFGRQAIFAPEGGGKPLVLGEGAQINESRIQSIQPNQVILASGAVLTPSFDKNRAPSTPFMPGVGPPGFPGFVNGQMPQVGLPMRPVMPVPQADTEAGDNGQEAAPQPAPLPGMPTPVPVFRGPAPSQRR